MSSYAMINGGRREQKKEPNVGILRTHVHVVHRSAFMNTKCDVVFFIASFFARSFTTAISNELVVSSKLYSNVTY